MRSSGRRTRRRTTDTRRTGRLALRRASPPPSPPPRAPHPRRRRRRGGCRRRPSVSHRATSRRRLPAGGSDSDSDWFVHRVVGTARRGHRGGDESPREGLAQPPDAFVPPPAARASRPRVAPRLAVVRDRAGMIDGDGHLRVGGERARELGAPPRWAPPRRAAAVRTGRGRPRGPASSTRLARDGGGGTQPRSPNPIGRSAVAKREPRRGERRRAAAVRLPGRRGRRAVGLLHREVIPRLERPRTSARAAPHRGCASPTGLAADTRRRTRAFPLGHAPGRSSRCCAAKMSKVTCTCIYSERVATPFDGKSGTIPRAC